MRIASLSALALIAVACGGGTPATQSAGSPSASARPSSTATVRIVSPKEGDVVRARSVTLRIALSGGKIVTATSQNLKPDEGHLHVLIDGRLVTMTGTLAVPLTDLANGAHDVRVEFVASDHAPFAPRVVATSSFEVAA
jgi:hypothetical protein